MAVKYRGYRDLLVYQKSFGIAMEIFNLTKSFPKEEKYALVDQIRRSSRAIGANITESWPKRKYVKHFILKLTDAQSEACETAHWLDVALSCNYIGKDEYNMLNDIIIEIQKMLDSMIHKPEKFCF